MLLTKAIEINLNKHNLIMYAAVSFQEIISQLLSPMGKLEQINDLNDNLLLIKDKNLFGLIRYNKIFFLCESYSSNLIAYTFKNTLHQFKEIISEKELLQLLKEDERNKQRKRDQLLKKATKSYWLARNICKIVEVKDS